MYKILQFNIKVPFYRRRHSGQTLMNKSSKTEQDDKTSKRWERMCPNARHTTHSNGTSIDSPRLRARSRKSLTAWTAVLNIGARNVLTVYSDASSFARESINHTQAGGVIRDRAKTKTEKTGG